MITYYKTKDSIKYYKFNSLLKSIIRLHTLPNTVLITGTVEELQDRYDNLLNVVRNSVNCEETTESEYEGVKTQVLLKINS